MGLGAQATLLTVSSATPSEINTELKYIALITVPVIKTLPFGVPVAWPQPFRRFHFFESPRSIAVVSPKVVLRNNARGFVEFIIQAIWNQNH